MRRALALLLVIGACAPSDHQSGPCGPDGEGCMSDGVSIEVINRFLALDPDREVVVARGGLVELFVDDGGASALDLTFSITGGELVGLEGGRTLTVRALAEELIVEVDIDRWGGYLILESREADDVKLMPVEDQFRYAGTAPDGFALVRDAFASVVVQLLGGDARLYDSSLATSAWAAGTEYGDVIVVNGTIDPVALEITADSVAREVEIPFAGEVTSIEVVEGPLLDDPRAPIVLGDDRLAHVCFTAMAGGLEVAGLEWRIQGPDIDSGMACAFVHDVVSGPLTVEVGGLSRTFDLQVEPL